MCGRHSGLARTHEAASTRVPVTSPHERSILAAAARSDRSAECDLAAGNSSGGTAAAARRVADNGCVRRCPRRHARHAEQWPWRRRRRRCLGGRREGGFARAARRAAPRLLPKRVAFPPSLRVRVVALAAGSLHSLALDDRGRVHSCGDGAVGLPAASLALASASSSTLRSSSELDGVLAVSDLAPCAEVGEQGEPPRERAAGLAVGLLGDMAFAARFVGEERGKVARSTVRCVTSAKLRAGVVGWFAA